VLYVASSILYDQFYVNLGLHPEDVGLTRAAILTRAAAGVVVIAGVGLVLGIVGMIISAAYWMILWLAPRC
jgi:hypothetical protein